MKSLIGNPNLKNTVRSVRIERLEDYSALDRFTCVPRQLTSSHVNSHDDYLLIDDFLKHKALDFEKSHLFRTKIIVDGHGNILAFYALCSGTRMVYRKFREQTHVPSTARNKAIPTIEMIWFAVATEHQHKGIGRKTLQHIYTDVISAAKIVGACIFIVEATADARFFYEQNGFKDIGEPHKAEGDVILGVSVADLESSCENS